MTYRLVQKTIPTRLSREKRGYGYRWRLARLHYLARNPLCRLCLQLGRTTAASVVDHIVKHHGPRDPLLWDRSNWQPLCKRCHDSVKQKFDRTGRIIAYGSDGWPLPSPFEKKSFDVPTTKQK
jgi:5-methylcytosine-specific restriction endonuclease McrA